MRVVVGNLSVFAKTPVLPETDLQIIAKSANTDVPLHFRSSLSTCQTSLC